MDDGKECPKTEHKKGRFEMAVSESRKKANAKWDSTNLDRMSVALPKGKKKAIQAAAALTGESMNQYIGTAVEMRMTGIPADGAPAPLSLLSPEGLQTAQTAATAAGEELPAFVERAVNAQAERDKRQKLFDCMTPKTE